jgi:hypothetical protein
VLAVRVRTAAIDAETAEEIEVIMGNLSWRCTTVALTAILSLTTGGGVAFRETDVTESDQRSGR